MNVRARVAVVVFGVGVALAACSHSPVGPSTTSSPAPAPTPSPAPALLVAVPLSPANNATIAVTAPPVPFVVRNASAAGDPVILITIEVATDTGFTHRVTSINVPQAAGGQTAINLSLAVSPFTTGETYYWRVRAGSGETIGSFSDPFAFTLGPRADTGPPSTGPLFADAPTPLQPEQGSLQSQHPVLVVRRAAHTGPPGSNSALYEFLTSTDAVRWTVSCTAYEFGAGDTTSCQASLSPGVNYWRARTVVGRRASDAGVTSAPSAVWSFTVAPQIILNPIPVLPPYGGIVHPRPTLTVAKATRSGPTGVLAYRFELASRFWDSTGTGAPAFDSSLVASATVPEAGERTSWTVPFDLMIGATYYWRVLSVEIASGVTSDYSVVHTFTVISNRSNLFTLDLRLPAACLPNSAGSSFAFFASSADTPGAEHFTLMTAGDLRLDLTTAGGNISGTIGGSAANVRGEPVTVFVAASSDSGAPASVSGKLGAGDQMSGSFSGFLRASSSIGANASCSAPDIGWTITPQQP